MIPLLIAAAASAAAGAMAQRNQAKAAGRAADKAQGYINKIEVPTVEEAQAQLESLVQQGVLTPEQAQAILQEQTAYSTIQEDPRLRAAQIDALGDLGDVVDEGGMDARFREALYNAQQQQIAQNRGQQDAIMANARARGIGGSNLETVNRLIAQQSAATRGAAAGVTEAAAAEERRMQALRDRAGLAGSVRDADYRRAAEEAAARDSINNFNVRARQLASNANVEAANRAQALNLGERQRIADANATNRNNAASEARELGFRKRTAQANAALGVGSAQVADAQRAAAAGQGASQAVGSLFDAYLKSGQQTPAAGSTAGQSNILADYSGVRSRY